MARIMSTARMTALVVVLAILGVLVVVLLVLPGADSVERPAERAAGAGAGATTGPGAAGSGGAEAAVPTPSVVLEQPTPSATVKAKATPTWLPGLSASRQRPHVHLPAHPASADGRLVDGYPAGAVPVAPRTRVVSSSVSAQGHRVQGTLVGSYDGSRARLQAFYRRAMGRMGLTGAAVPALAPARATSFSDGVDSVTLTVRPPRAGRVPFSLVLTLQAHV
jgi:hypothetical protein